MGHSDHVPCAKEKRKKKKKSSEDCLLREAFRMTALGCLIFRTFFFFLEHLLLTAIFKRKKLLRAALNQCMRVFGQNIDRLQHVQEQGCIKICKTLLKKVLTSSNRQMFTLYTSLLIYGFVSESVLEMCAH